MASESRFSRVVSALRIPLMAAAVAGAVLVPTAATMAVAPQPEPFPTKWEFDFKPGPLRLTTMSVDGERQAFLYMTFQVSNYSGQDRMLAPSFDLLTDTGAVVRAGRDVPPEVTRTLIDRLDNPLLEDQLSIVNVLLQGIENSKQGLVVWRFDDAEADELTVFASGFSGEFTPYFTEDPETGERVRHVLRKTRMLRYGAPGDVMDRGSEPFDQTEAGWVMR